MSAFAAAAFQAQVRFDEVVPEDLPKIIALALVLDRSQRRSRFGATPSDEAIRRHYIGQDFSRFMGLGVFVQRRLEAFVEIYALGDDWKRAEICALGLSGAQARWGAELLAAAATRAHARGCRELLWIDVGAPDGWAAAITAAQNLGQPQMTLVSAR